MQWVEESFELLVSSDIGNGAVRKSASGDRFSVEFNEPIGLPKGAITPTVQCYGASIWWTIPNIVDSGTTQNNLFGFTYTRVPVGILNQVQIDIGNADYSFGLLGPSYVNRRIPNGLYTFTSLVNAIHNDMVSISGIGLPQIQQAFQFYLDPVTAFIRLTIDITWTASSMSGAFFAWRAGLGFASIFGFPGDQDIGLTATRTGSNVVPAIPGIWEYESPAASQFGSNVVIRSGLAIPTGLYNIDQLLVAIREQMVVAGLTQSEAENFISFDGDNSRQIVIVTLNCPIVGSTANAPYAFEFGNNGTRGFEALLGFTDWPRPGSPGPSKLLLGNFPDPGGDVVYHFYADRIAAFNRVNYILAHTDLVPRGIRYNGSFYQIVAQILVDVAPGEQIVYAPFNPPICDGANLVGAQRSNAEFWLTNDNNEPVDTFGENWSLRLVFKYKIAKST